MVEITITSGHTIARRLALNCLDSNISRRCNVWTVKDAVAMELGGKVGRLAFAGNTKNKNAVSAEAYPLETNSAPDALTKRTLNDGKLNQPSESSTMKTTLTGLNSGKSAYGKLSTTFTGRLKYCFGAYCFLLKLYGAIFNQPTKSSITKKQLKELSPVSGLNPGIGVFNWGSYAV